jgi:hypothetical protein
MDVLARIALSIGVFIASGLALAGMFSLLGDNVLIRSPALGTAVMLVYFGILIAGLWLVWRKRKGGEHE